MSSRFLWPSSYAVSRATGQGGSRWSPVPGHEHHCPTHSCWNKRHSSQPFSGQKAWLNSRHAQTASLSDGPKRHPSHRDRDMLRNKQNVHFRLFLNFTLFLPLFH